MLSISTQERNAFTMQSKPVLRYEHDPLSIEGSREGGGGERSQGDRSIMGSWEGGTDRNGGRN